MDKPAIIVFFLFTVIFFAIFIAGAVLISTGIMRPDDVDYAMVYSMAVSTVFCGAVSIRGILKL